MNCRSSAGVNISILACLGTGLANQREHQEGYTFLIVYAPSEAETTRVPSVARRFGTRLAHK